MGFLKPEQVSGGDLPWHALHSRPSNLQLPWTPLSYRCWLPSSAVLPVSWLVLCWRCCCWPLECWVGFRYTLHFPKPEAHWLGSRGWSEESGFPPPSAPLSAGELRCSPPSPAPANTPLILKNKRTIEHNGQ